MCQEPLFRKFKLKVNSTGTILSDKTADSGASWDNIYSPFLLMASAASQVITVMHLLNLTGAAAPKGPGGGPAAPSAGQLHPPLLVCDYYKSESRRRVCFPLLKMFKLHALQMSLPRTGFHSVRLGRLALGGFCGGGARIILLFWMRKWRFRGNATCLGPMAGGAPPQNCLTFFFVLGPNGVSFFGVKIRKQVYKNS